MHIVSDKSLQRPGYVYNDQGVGYPCDCFAGFLIKDAISALTSG
jgi:hypothetical protein